MFRASITQRVFVIGLLTALLAGGNALADRDGRGGGGGGGGRSGGGGGGGGGSSRSFSGGGGGSSRSFGGGGESAARSMPSRSFSGGDSSSRGSSPRSFSSGSSRSISEGSRSSAPSIRSFEGRSSFGRSSDGSSSPPRTFSTQPSTRSFEGMRSGRDSGDSSSVLRSYQRSPSGQATTDGSALRSFNRSSGDSSQYGRSLGNPGSNSNGTTTDSSNAVKRFERGDSSRSISEFNRSRGQSGDSQSLNRREYTAGRPTNDQVRDFLQLRRDGQSNQAGGPTAGGSGNQSVNLNSGARRIDSNFNRGDGNRNVTDGLTDGSRQEKLRSRVTESQNEGDRAWSRRFGSGDNNRGENKLGDQTARSGNSGPRDGDFSRRPGDANGPNGGRGDNGGNLSGGRNDRDGREFGKNGNNDGRNRDFGDRKFVDGKYQDWKKGAWHGDRGDGRDHRDWSGRWKDGDRFVAANRIRDHWHGNRGNDRYPFCSGWWSGYGRSGWRWNYWDSYARINNRPWFWWSWCAAPRLTSWVSFGWNTPYYWDYGPGEYIYCYDNVIYVNGRWFQPAPIYYENTVVLAQRAPDFTPEQAQQEEWLPLGVFAVARDGVPDKNVVVQLAVTKDGIIGGTVFNQTTGASFAVEGTVDKSTQRAVWTYVDDKNARIVMETSVYNLTQPESTGLIHYGPDDIQVVELVRLEQPDAGAAPAPSLPPAAAATGELPAP